MTSLLMTGGFVLAVVALFGGIIWLAERKAKAELWKERLDEDMANLRKTIEADARARERIARGELLHDDGHRRD